MRTSNVNLESLINSDDPYGEKPKFGGSNKVEHVESDGY
jgi:hypothetical protein